MPMDPQRVHRFRVLRRWAPKRAGPAREGRARGGGKRGCGKGVSPREPRGVLRGLIARACGPGRCSCWRALFGLCFGRGAGAGWRQAPWGTPGAKPARQPWRMRGGMPGGPRGVVRVGGRIWGAVVGGVRGWGAAQGGGEEGEGRGRGAGARGGLCLRRCGGSRTGVLALGLLLRDCLFGRVGDMRRSGCTGWLLPRGGFLGSGGCQASVFVLLL